MTILIISLMMGKRSGDSEKIADDANFLISMIRAELTFVFDKYAVARYMGIVEFSVPDRCTV